MKYIDTLIEKAKLNRKTIVLPEANDIRTLKAAEIIYNKDFADIILIGNEEKILNLAKSNNIIINSRIIDPDKFEDTNKLIEYFYELRKEKGMTKDEAKSIITTNYLYFGCMLVKMGYADGQVSGATHSTSDTLRPALQILKTDKESPIASSFFLMDTHDTSIGENGLFIYSDCGMIQSPTKEELVEIAKSSEKTFRLLINDNPRIAFLSHSTLGSSKCDDAYKVVDAVKLTKEKYPELLVDGELQFDAAVIPSVAKSKAPNSKVAGKANILIFPDLDAGNIAYKITERIGHADAYGPVMQGLAKPVNDLSRGCKAEDIVGVVAITSLQAK